MAEPASSQVPGERPLRLELPGGVVLAVDPAVTGPGGTLGLPESVHHAGWWVGGARLGDPYGAVVIAAHVDSVADGVGPMAGLLDAETGDVLRLESAHLAQDFEIDRVAFVPRESLASERATMSFRGSARLVLVTCGGPYDVDGGGYRDNLVVVAAPRGPLEVSAG